MAQIVLTDVDVEVNSVDLSDHVTSVTINFDVDAVEVTAMSDTAHKFTGGTTTVVILPTSNAISATNPSYTLTDTFVASFQPINGSVGELSMTSVEFQGGTLTRATT